MNLEYLGVGAAITLLLALPFNFYAMLTKVEATERYLPNCEFIVKNIPAYRHQPFEGKQMRLMFLAYVLIMPKAFYWRRLVVLEEIASVPTHLKRWVVLPCIALTLSTLTAMTSGFFLYYSPT